MQSAPHLPYNSPCNRWWLEPHTERVSLTELRELLKPSQRMTPKHLTIRRRQRPDGIRAGEHELVLRGLGGLPLLAVFGHEQAKFVLVVDDLHVRRVVEVVDFRGRAKEQHAGCLGEAVEARFYWLLAGFWKVHQV